MALTHHGLIDTFAEPNPDKLKVHLPMVKSDVHGMYIDEVRCGKTDLQPVCSTWFNTVWRVRVPHLKVRVFHTRRYMTVHMREGCGKSHVTTPIVM